MFVVELSVIFFSTLIFSILNTTLNLTLDTLGTSMTGNVGRKLLKNYVRLAEIVFPKLRQETGQALIQALGNVWIALVCGWVVDPEKFGDYSNHVDNMFRTHVPWHPGVPGEEYLMFMFHKK